MMEEAMTPAEVRRRRGAAARPKGRRQETGISRELRTGQARGLIQIAIGIGIDEWAGAGAKLSDI